MRQIHRRALSIGLRVAVVPIEGLRSVAALLAVRAGQWFEPDGRPGVARLTAQTLLRGTIDRDVTAWSDAIDALGASARLDVGSHSAIFSGQCLGDDLGAFLGIVAETVARPALTLEGLEFVRAQTIADLEESAKDTRSVADRAWHELAYPAGHPFHTRTVGDESVIRGATQGEIVDFHRTVIRPNGSVLVLAGALEPERAFDLVERAFATWTRGPAHDRPALSVALTTALRRAVTVTDKTQSDVVLGWLGLPRTDPRFTAAQVTNMVFAADTLASRAGHVVRDELGLAYYVFSTISGTLTQGPWVVRMGVNPEHVERAIAETFKELGKIREGDIADNDLALARDKLVGELEVGQESPSGVAGMVLEAELFGLGDDHFERYVRELRAVTKDDVVATARDFLSLDRYALAIAGPELR
ncbi:MAG TPA: pitrilysin family protein [Candidatus Limnocylindria bacterium]|nr:pitrilysin family protein [Candidatus Limnocylindria bacterium]